MSVVASAGSVLVRSLDDAADMGPLDVVDRRIGQRARGQEGSDSIVQRLAAREAGT